MTWIKCDEAVRNSNCLTAGIGLRAPHYREVLQNLPKLGWVEVPALRRLCDEHALQHVATRIQHAQEMLGCRVLIRNLSIYLTFNSSKMSEGEFLVEVSRR